MKNTPEMNLIRKFEEVLNCNEVIDNELPSNFGRNTAILADVEYVANTGEYIVIEAKSHHSKDAHNSYHKLFGELLKETGKNIEMRSQEGKKASLAILLPEDSCERTGVTKMLGNEFYQNHFNNIPETIYDGFGQLVNAKYVFVCSEVHSRVMQYTWMGFYKGDDPIKIWYQNK